MLTRQRVFHFASTGIGPQSPRSSTTYIILVVVLAHKIDTVIWIR